MTVTDHAANTIDAKHFGEAIDDLLAQVKQVMDARPVEELGAPQLFPTLPAEKLQEDLIGVGLFFRRLHGETSVAPAFAKLMTRSYQSNEVCCVTVLEGINALSMLSKQLLMRSPVFSG